MELGNLLVFDESTTLVLFIFLESIVISFKEYGWILNQAYQYDSVDKTFFSKDLTMLKSQIFLLIIFLNACGSNKPNVTIAAVFDIQYYDHFSRILFNYVGQNVTNDVSLHGIAIDARDNIDGTLRGLCSLFENNNIIAFIVIGSSETLHSVNLVTTPLKIPVLSYNTDKNLVLPKVSITILIYFSRLIYKPLIDQTLLAVLLYTVTAC